MEDTQTHKSVSRLEWLVFAAIVLRFGTMLLQGLSLELSLYIATHRPVFGYATSSFDVAVTLAGGIIAVTGVYLLNRRAKAADETAKSAQLAVDAARDGDVDREFRHGVEMLGTNTIAGLWAGLSVLEVVAAKRPVKYGNPIQNVLHGSLIEICHELWNELRDPEKHDLMQMRADTESRTRAVLTYLEANMYLTGVLAIDFTFINCRVVNAEFNRIQFNEIGFSNSRLTNVVFDGTFPIIEDQVTFDGQVTFKGILFAEGTEITLIPMAPPDGYFVSRTWPEIRFEGCQFDRSNPLQINTVTRFGVLETLVDEDCSMKWMGVEEGYDIQPSEN